MHRISIGKNEAEVALIQNLNQELLFERIRIQMKYLKFKPKLAFKYGPYWTKNNYHKPKFHQKNFSRCKSSLCQHDPMKSFYSHDLFYSYILMQIIWLGLKESYHTTTTFFFSFFLFLFLIRVYQDLGIWVLSAIRICLRIFVFFLRSLRHFVKHLGLAYFHKGYQFLYHSLTIIPAKHEKEKEL